MSIANQWIKYFLQEKKQKTILFSKYKYVEQYKIISTIFVYTIYTKKPHYLSNNTKTVCMVSRAIRDRG